MQTPDLDQSNPYVGPQPFEQEDQSRYFGREREASDLCSLIKANRVMLVYAQSGTGKTSLIKAGLIPMLQADGVEVLPPARLRGLIPETIPYETIENPYVFNTLISWAPRDADPAPLLNQTIPQFLKNIPHLVDDAEFESIRVAIFDQFEELFSFYPDHWQERRKFFEQVRDALAADELLRVVLVMREDYIAQLDPYAALLPDKLRSRFRLSHMTREAALAAIKRPLETTTRCFAPGVAEALADKLLSERVETPEGKPAVITGEFVEPVLLQVVCQSLWKRLPPEVTEITLDHLRDFGDVNRAMSQFYQDCLDATVEQTGVSERTLRDWFDQKLITSAGTRSTVYQEQQTTGGLPNDAVRVLEDQHLVRAELRAGSRWYELNHDSFIEPIQTSNKAWRARQDIIDQADLMITLRRLRRFAWIGGVVAIVVIVALAFWFIISRSNTYAAFAIEQSTQAAQSGSLSAAVQASSLLAAGNTDLALILALQGIALNPPSVPAQHVLFASAYAGTRRLFSGDGASINTVALSPDGQYALSGATDGSLILWDVATGRPVRPFLGQAAVNSVAISPDGKLALSGAVDGSLMVWDVATGKNLYALTGDGAPVTSVALSPDGKYALSGSSGGITLWDTSNWTTLQIYPSAADSNSTPTTSSVLLGAVNSVAFSPDGKYALAGGCAPSNTSTQCQEGQLIAWSIPDFQPVDLNADAQGAINSVAFSPDGIYALSASSDNTLVLWDTANWMEVSTFSGHTGSVNSVAFSPDGKYAISGSNDNTLILWDVASGLALRSFDGHNASVYGVAFSSDGKNVISASQDGTLRLWDVTPPEQSILLGGHSDEVTAIAFSPDGKTVFSASLDQTISMTAADGSAPPHYFTGEDEPITALAVSPDGQSLASGGNQGVVNLWDVQSGLIVQRFFRHLRTVTALAFSPDGSRIVSGSKDGSVYVWDIKTGQQTVLAAGSADYSSPAIGGVAFSPDGQDVLYSVADNTVHLADAQTGAELRVFQTNDVPTGIAFSPDGRTALVTSNDRTLGLWDLASAGVQTHPILTFTGHSDAVTSVAFSPDGRTAVSGSCARLDTNYNCVQGEVILWDVATGQALYTLTSQTNRITSVAFSPDGKTVAAGSSDDTTAMWPIWSVDELVGWIRANRYLASPTCAQRLQYQIDPLCDPNATPTPVAPSPTLTPGPSLTLTPTPTPTFTAVGPQTAKLGWNSGYFPAGGHERWTFVGQAGETLALRVNADQPANNTDDYTRLVEGLFDSLLTIYSPNGTILDQNDDMVPSMITDSVIDSLTLPFDGTYTIDVGSFNNTSGGAYSLVIQPVKPSVAIALGQTVSGVVEGVGDRNQWTFSGTAGDLISVTINPYDAGLSPCVQLYGTHGQPLPASDTSCANTTTGATSVSFTLPDSGNYTVVVRDVTTGVPGAYSLSLADLTAATATATPVPTSVATGTLPPPAAQGTIAPGDTVTGSIEPGSDQKWTFDGISGETVLIRMDAAQNRGLHPVLELDDDSGTMMETNESANGISASAQIGPITLPYSGSYTLSATSANFNYGAFILTFQLAEAPLTTPIPYASPTTVPIESIETGETLPGKLDFNENNVWTFDGQKGQIVSIKVQQSDSASGLTPLSLQLLAPDGSYVTESYAGVDGEADTGAVILPQTGTYIITVFTMTGESSSYRLSLTDLTGVSPTPTPIPSLLPSRTPTVVSTPQGTLSPGATIKGVIQQPNDINQWTFDGTAGDPISLIMKPDSQSDLYPMLELRGPDGAVLIDNPDMYVFSDFSTAEIDAYPLPESGVYSVLAEGYAQSVGAYTLSFDNLNLMTATPSLTPSPTPTPFLKAIVPGVPVSGEIADVGEHQQWTFAGTQGHVVTITMRADGSTLDSYVELFGSSGLIAADDNFEQATNDAQIALFTLPATDTYTISASGYGYSVGAYTLTLTDDTLTTPTATPPPTVTTTPDAGSIVGGQTIGGALPESRKDTWLFNGIAGETITINVGSDLTLPDTTFDLEGPDGSLITENEAYDTANAQIGPQVLTATGTYTLIAHSYIDVPITAQITLVVEQPTAAPSASPTPTPTS